tara:strand:+ start:363 stop:530 length:168 start_codon:yes stop_codon:yes gene_type:complete
MHGRNVLNQQCFSQIQTISHPFIAAGVFFSFSDESATTTKQQTTNKQTTNAWLID